MRHWLSQGTRSFPEGRGTGCRRSIFRTLFLVQQVTEYRGGVTAGLEGSTGRVERQEVSRGGGGSWGVRQEQQASTTIPGVREGETIEKGGLSRGGDLFISLLTVLFCVSIPVEAGPETVQRQISGLFPVRHLVWEVKFGAGRESRSPLQ